MGGWVGGGVGGLEGKGVMVWGGVQTVPVLKPNWAGLRQTWHAPSVPPALPPTSASSEPPAQ